MTCTCGHAEAAHRHHRRHAAYCGHEGCACNRYQPCPTCERKIEPPAPETGGNPMTEPGTWRKSSYSYANGNCPEVAFAESGRVDMRNSREPKVFLAFTSAEWAAFIAGVKNGEFDLPKETT